MKSKFEIVENKSIYKFMFILNYSIYIYNYQYNKCI